MLAEQIPVPLRELPDGLDVYVLAIDLGTGGPKAAVISAKGKIIAHGFVPVPLELLGTGGAEQDPKLWWEAVVEASRSALLQSGVSPTKVIGVGCTAQWLGTVPIDAKGTTIGNAIIWMDSRGANEVLKKVRGKVNVLGYRPLDLLRWIRKTGGVPSLSGKDPVGHILYLKNQQRHIYDAAQVFLEPVDFLNFRLTGLLRASGDSITLHWVTNNRNIRNIDYDRKLLAMTGLDRKKLPDLLPTGSLLGGLSAKAAQDLGLKEGTPVATGTGDLHSAAVGSGRVEDFGGHLYIGTSSWISCHVPFKKVAPNSNITSIPAGVPGKYIVADEHETGGACLSWLKDNLFYPNDALSATGPPPKDVFNMFNELAESSPLGSGGVLFTPWLNGERSPVDDHTIRGGFHNLSLASSRADLIRAVFEGVAFNSRWLLEAVERYTKRPFPSLAFIGGGANSELWSKLHADICGRTIYQMDDPVLANVRGAGILTLLALKRITLRDVPAMVSVKKIHEPDMEAFERYREPYEAFVSLYTQTKGIHRKLNRHRLSAKAGS